MTARRLSSDGLRALMLLEGFRAESYRCEAGKLTIGFGHVITRSEQRKGRFPRALSRTDAETLLRQDVERFERVVDAMVDADIQLAQHEVDALILFVFNVGEDAFQKSTLRQFLNERKPTEEVAAQFARWVYATDPKSLRKVASEGLRRRRAIEAKLWLGGAP